jgi:hypothetical protein
MRASLHRGSPAVVGYGTGFHPNRLTSEVAAEYLKFITDPKLLGAYAVARFRFPGRNWVLFFLLLTQLVPASSLIIPLFLTFRGDVLYDSLPAIAIAYVDDGGVGGRLDSVDAAVRHPPAVPQRRTGGRRIKRMSRKGKP